MLVSAIVNITKVAKITKPINLTQSALFVTKRATLPENAGTIPLDHLLLMLPKTYKDIGDARYTFQGAIAAPIYPTDQALPPTLNQMTTKYPTTLLMFQLTTMCH